MTQNVSKTSLEKPLLGAVLCCTSIAPEDRTRLAEYAEQMGAEHKLDLTSDVTHLLVGSTDTPKYQYVAREREDVKVLRPEWIEAVRERWMEDLPLDMNALEAEYRMPTLAGLRICITGFDDLSFRAGLQKNVMANGGEYTGDLTKDVTHLIAAKPEGKKYEYATLWQKKVVSLQWYSDTLQRGMQLDEHCYHPSRPVEEQGIGAWNRQPNPGMKAGKRLKEEQPVQEPTRKLRRIASAKLGNQADNMWGDIVGPSSQQAATTRDGLRPAKSLSSLGTKHQQREVTKHEQPKVQPTSGTSTFLHGSYFVVNNFDQRKNALVLRTLQAAGAIVLDSLPDLLTHDGVNSQNAYVIVPHQTSRNEVPRFGKSKLRPSVVTELWLERCMVQKAIISVSQYPLGGMITRVPSSDIAGFTVNATGFQPIETLHIAKTVGLTGATYSEVFTPKSSILVCNSMNINNQKLYHARQWNIPAVSEIWLCKLLTEGSLPDFKHYLIQDVEEGNDLEAELNQKRSERQPRQSPHDDGDEESQRMNKLSQSAASQSSNSFVHVHKRDVEDQRGMTEKQTDGQNPGRSNRNNNMIEDRALREISPNSPSRRNRLPLSPTKKSLFRTYDRGSSTVENKTEDPGVQPRAQECHSTNNTTSSSPKRLAQDASSINSAIQDLLKMKAKARANASAHQNEFGSKKKKLLSRALSNLSNASHASRLSRASSIDSLNTDGIGSEIAPPSGKSASVIGNAGRTQNGSLEDQAQSKTSSAAPPNSVYHSAPIDLSDPHLLRDEFEVEQDAPQMTQLGYEDSEEAIALREKLAEKRRARSKLGQNDDDPKPEIRGKEREALKQKEKQVQVIRDDDTLNATGWGGGRRTRAKNRSTDTTEWELW